MCIRDSDKAVAKVVESIKDQAETVGDNYDKIEQVATVLSLIHIQELSQKTKEYSWQLAAAYADYCEANNKYISWNDLPYLQQVVEYERPASLETYRLEHKANKEELDKFLNTYKEYKDLVKKQKEAVTKEEKDAVSTAFSAFWKKLRSEELSLIHICRRCYVNHQQ